MCVCVFVCVCLCVCMWVCVWVCNCLCGFVSVLVLGVLLCVCDVDGGVVVVVLICILCVIACDVVFVCVCRFLFASLILHAIYIAVPLVHTYALPVSSTALVVHSRIYPLDNIPSF